MKRMPWALALAALVSAHVATAQVAKEPLSAYDKKFMREARIAHLAEMKLGQLAQRHGQSNFVRRFGKMMEHDHLSASNELRQLAKDHNFALPTRLDAKHQAVYNRLSRLRGAAFDKAYRAEMLKGHKQVHMKFEKAAQMCSNDDLKAYAARHLPVIAHHLDMLQSGRIMMMQ